jgi:hypothetical protein
MFEDEFQHTNRCFYTDQESVISLDDGGVNRPSHIH